MKVVILVAGLGSRLDSALNHLPKTLTKLINGKSILQFQLETLSPFVSMDSIYLVVGYKKEAIMDHFPDLTYVYNSHFAEENTAKSLLKALKKIDHDDILWLNGDVVVRREVIESLLKQNRSLMVVNQLEVGEEEVKYRSDNRGKIIEVSKSVSNPQGEALGINFIKKADLNLLRQSLYECHNSDYFEKGIQTAIEKGLEIWKFLIDSKDCSEIDFPEDLIRANQLIRQWNSS